MAIDTKDYSNKNTSTKIDFSKEPHLSHLQKSMLYQSLLQPAKPLYMLQSYLYITGELDIDKYKRAWQYLFECNPSLQRSFTCSSKGSVEIIENKVTLSVTMHKLAKVEQHREKALHDYLVQDQQQPFSLSEAPLMRLALLQWSPKEHYVVLTCHHALLDGYSALRLIKDVMAYYNMQLKQEKLSPIIFQNHNDTNQKLSTHPISICDSKRLNLTEPYQMALPTQRGTEELLTKQYSVTVDQSTQKKLRQWCKQNNCPLSIGIYISWGIVLKQYSQHNTVCFGVIRQIPKEKRTDKFGLFINTLPISFSFARETSLQNCLEVAIHQFRNFKENISTPLPDWFPQKDGGSNNSAWFDSIVNVMSPSPTYFAKQYKDENLNHEKADFFVSTEYRIMLDVFINASEMKVRINYNTSFITKCLAKQMLEHFIEALKMITSMTTSTLTNNIDILRPCDYEMLLTNWNKTHASYPEKSTLIDLFEEQCQRTPEAIALKAISQNRVFSYNELNKSANQLASIFFDQGICQQNLVGICIDRSYEMIIAFLAILKTGARYLPLDPVFPDNRLQFMLEDSLCNIVILSSKHYYRFSKLSTQLNFKTPLTVLEIEALLKTASGMKSEFDAKAKYQDEISVIYTSGSTGRPKGVCNLHKGAVNRVFWMQSKFALTPQDCVLQKTPLHFGVSVWEIFWPLISGASMVLAPHNAQYDMHLLWQIIQEQQVTTLHFVPSSLSAFMQHPEIDKCQSIRHIFSSGEVLRWSVQKQLLDKLPHTKLYNLYGPTESSVDVTYWQCQSTPTLPRVPIGYPIANTQIYILNQQKRLVPSGTIGELYIGGVGLASGYSHQPEWTKERFIMLSLPGKTAQRLYRTGDLAAWRFDGSIDYIGRVDQQIKLRGYRIELGEIESCLLNNDIITGAVVLLKQLTIKSKALVAYVVPKAGAQFEEGLLKKQLQKFLPEYMCPNHWVVMGSLPYLPNGKINRNALPEPNLTKQIEYASFKCDNNETAQILRNIWQSILKIDNVKYNDNFFMLGGDSIIAIQVSLQAARYGLNISPQRIFQYPSIDRLSNWIESQTTNNSLMILPNQQEVSLIQKWFLESQTSSAWNYFHQILIFRCQKPLSSKLLEKAWQAVISHHAIFSYKFTKKDNTWLAKKTNAPLLAIERYCPIASDPSIFSLRDDPNLLRQHDKINIHDGPLVRIILIESQSHEVLYSYNIIHHLVTDAVSWSILCDHVTLAYEQLDQNQLVRLPKLTSSYFNWAKSYSSALTEIEMPNCPQSVIPASLNINNTIESSDLIVFNFSKEKTFALEKYINTLHVNRLSLLIYIIAKSAFSQTTQENIQFAFEKNGRESKDDLTSTIGWFTKFCSIKIERKHIIGDIEEVLRKLNQKIYLSVEKTTMPPNRDFICLNDIGNIDQWSHSSPLFEMYYDPYLPTRHSSSNRYHWIEVDSFIQEGELHIAWRYPKQVQSYFDVSQCSEYCGYILNHTFETIQLSSTVSYPAYVLNARLSNTQCAKIKLLKRKWEDLGYIDETDVVESLYPMTESQQHMLYHCLQYSDGCYTNQVILSLSGVLDIENLDQTWQHLIRSHKMLRAGIVNGDTQNPLIGILSNVTGFTIKQISSLKELESYTHTLRKTGIPLDKLPLFELGIFKHREDQYTLVFTYHHLIMDGWSVSILLQAVFSELDTKLQSSHIFDYTSSFTDMYWRFLQSKKENNDKAYWNNLLQNAPETLIYQLANVLDPQPSGKKNCLDDHYQAASFFITNDISNSLRSFSKNHATTLNIFFQAIWTLLLNHYSQESDIVFGMAMSGRDIPLPNINSAIGMFIKNIPVRVQLTEDMKFIDLIQLLQKQFTESSKHSDYPMRNMLRHSGSMHLYDTVLVYENYPLDFNENNTQLKITGYESYDPTQNSLTVLILPRESFRFFITYNTEIWHKDHISILFEHISILINQVLNKPNIPVFSTEILPHKLKAQYLSLNQTFSSYPEQLGIHHLFEMQVKNNSDQVALIDSHQDITYSQLNALTNQLARYLQDKGVRTNTLVVVIMSRHIACVVGLLATLKVGAAYVPVSVDSPIQRIQSIMKNCKTDYLLTDQISVYNAINAKHLPFWKSIQESIPSYSQDNLNTKYSKHNLCYIIFTSGSTGKPKGVRIKHGALTNCLTSFIGRIAQSTEKVRWLAVTDISFDIAAMELFYPLITGGTCIINSSLQITGITPLKTMLYDHNITHLQATPSILRYLIQNHVNLQNVVVMSGGEALDITLSQSLTTKCKDLWNLYGPTETTIWSTAYHYKNDHALTTSVPIGRPIGNTRIYVLDKLMRIVPPNIIGQIYIAGDGLSCGYLHNPELTSKFFIEHKFSDGSFEKLYSTGDRGYWRVDGELIFMGRQDHQIKYHGVRIEYGEIESQIKKYPAVKEAIVVLQEEHSNNVESTRLAAFVVWDSLSYNGEEFDSTRRIINSNWKTIYENIYANSVDTSNQINGLPLDISGWKNSYNQKSFSLNEMYDWVQHTINLIKQCEPRCILEIGCGTGLLLSELAADCQQYYATDISITALKKLELKLKEKEYCEKVQLIFDNSIVQKNFCDLVVLNSVAQYFSDGNYLKEQMLLYIEYLETNGKLFFGDIESLDHRELFYLSLEAKNQENTSVGDILTRIRYHKYYEKELLISPQYFIKFSKQHPRITYVDIQLKNSQFKNEMSQYRYNVMLYTDKNTSSHFVLNWEIWNQIKSYKKIEKILCKKPRYLAVKSIPNINWQEVTFLEKINSNPSHASLSLMQNDDTNIEWIDPIILGDISSQYGYQIKLIFNECNPMSHFDILFYRENDHEIYESTFINTHSDKSEDHLVACKDQQLTNIPFRYLYDKQIKEIINKHLKEQLPSTMIPSKIEIIDNMPLTVSGKIDRKFLAKQEYLNAKKELKKPNFTSSTEINLNKIWSSLLSLSIDSIGPDDNFFEIGGHSLLALQLLSEISKQYHVDIVLSELFRHSKLSELASFVDQRKKQINNELGSHHSKKFVHLLQPHGKTIPIFLIHPVGGTVFCYYPLVKALGKERKIYAIEDPGIHINPAPFNSIEAMAAAYLRIVRQKQASGPYILCGASLGGVIAFEMASQLEKKSGEKSMTFLIDSWAKSSEPMKNPVRLKEAMLRQYKITKEKLIGHDIPNPESWLTLHQKRMTMGNVYYPPSISEPVHLFKSKTLMPNFQPVDDKTNYWSNHAINLVTEIYPGDHETILLPENISALASSMKIAIEHFLSLMITA